MDYNLRGYAKYKLGKMKLALRNFNKALTLDNKYAEAYINRGNLLFD